MNEPIHRRVPQHAEQATRAVDVFLTYLKAESATVIFGIPGGLLHPFFESVERDADFQLIVAKHEEGAAFMADGFARVGGHIAVCAGTSGPGSTNMLTGVACAFADGVPMLVVTGQAASYALGRGAAQETNREDIDIVEMFRPVTKYSAMVTNAASLPHHLRRAMRRALMGRPGPVHLNVPVDLWHQRLEEDWFEPETYRPEIRAFDRKSVQRASKLLMRAHRPVILAGSGVTIAHAEPQLVALAELLPAAVTTSPRAKGVFSEQHPLSLGVLGFAGHEVAREVVFGDEVDVLLTVGASLNETTTLNWRDALRPSRALIQIDIDADRVGRNYPVDIPLVGDAQAVLVELVYHLHRALRDGESPASVWPRSQPISPPDARRTKSRLRTSGRTPVTPQRWRADLQEVMPHDAIVFSDIGGHMLFNIHELFINETQNFVLNLGLGSMGHGTAAAIGAALAHSNRTVFAIVGDACFTMNGMELLTAAEYRIPVIWIVENNQMHGIVWHGSKMVSQGRGLESIRYRRPVNVSAIATAMGVKSWRVEKPGQMRDAVMQALRSGAPALIEVMVDPSISPPLADRAKTIAGFKKG